MTVEGTIGFPDWIVDDDAWRAKGMERAKREMDHTAQSLLALDSQSSRVYLDNGCGPIPSSKDAC